MQSAAGYASSSIGTATWPESVPAGDIRIWYNLPHAPRAAHPLLPIVSLAAGVFLLIAPRIVSFAVAVYLIIVGILGLNGIYHRFK
jgi:hypothetical protein